MYFSFVCLFLIRTAFIELRQEGVSYCHDLIPLSFIYSFAVCDIFRVPSLLCLSIWGNESVFEKVEGTFSSGSHRLYWKEPRWKFRWPSRQASRGERTLEQCVLSFLGQAAEPFPQMTAFFSQVPSLPKGRPFVAWLVELEGCSSFPTPRPSPPLPAWLFSSASSLPVSSSEDYFFLGKSKRKGGKKPTQAVTSLILSSFECSKVSQL